MDERTASGARRGRPSTVGTRRDVLLAGATGLVVGLAGCVGGSDTSVDDTTDPTSGDGATDAGVLDRDAIDEAAGALPLTVETATMYKGPSCDCCEAYADYLDDELEGDLDVVTVDDLASELADRGVAREYWSCHVVELDDDLVVGHVPAAVIAAFRDGETSGDGVALPGMPAGTPGMGGQKSETWTFYEVPDDDPDVFAAF